MRRAFALVFALFVLPAGACAQDAVADFYRGKNLNLIVGYSAGGGYDTYARIVARHLGKHIPGQPSVVVQNMPGAGSLKLANFLFNVAPKDGATIGTFSRGMAMEPLIGGSNVQFDATRFAWLGSGTNEVSVFTVWHTAPIRTWQDMLEKPFTVGGEGSGSDPDIYALLLKNAFGAKLKLISGYPGTAEIAIALERGEVDSRASWSWSSLKALRPQWIAETVPRLLNALVGTRFRLVSGYPASTEAMLAMERGEVDGASSSWAAVKVGKQAWLRENKIKIILQTTPERIAELPHTPSLGEIGDSAEDRQVFALYASGSAIGRSVLAPPGLPPERVQALRGAFQAMVKDPEFVADIQRLNVELDPLPGEQVGELVVRTLNVPAAVRERAKLAFGR